jgi:hypothetical protein
MARKKIRIDNGTAWRPMLKGADVISVMLNSDAIFG